VESVLESATDEELGIAALEVLALEVLGEEGVEPAAPVDI
jgi:hypothetical protein